MGTSEDVDVVIIGAGLSGIGAAWRLQERRPGTSYVVLEARDDLGGTWDLFRYPGIRSDSDMYTFAFPFSPWTSDQVLGDGPSIKAYVERTAREAGIDRHIRFGTKVTTASWSSSDQRWSVTTRDRDGVERTVRCRFLFGCSGYYDYERPHTPDFPGRDDYRGLVVEPQRWPAGLDHTGKRVAVIGSGATAVTIVPAMAETAAHVTMVQRSPGYMASLPVRDRGAERLRASLPGALGHKAVRARSIVLSEASYRFARAFPDRFAALLRRGLARHLSDDVLDEHFTPSYRPWDQRVCRIPAGDLTRAIADGRADIVTDTIERFVPEGIRLTSGRTIEADIVVSATGLTMLAMGGVAFDVDGEPVDLSQRFAYRGLMLEGVPNFAFSIGYVNASWTLRSDLVARYVCRLLAHMERKSLGVATPRAASAATRRRPRPILGLTSGYVLRAIEGFPKLGPRSPWTYRQSYLAESPTLTLGDVRHHMRFEPARDGAPSPAPSPELQEVVR